MLPIMRSSSSPSLSLQRGTVPARELTFLIVVLHASGSVHLLRCAHVLLDRSGLQHKHALHYGL